MMKKLGSRNYALISNGVNSLGTYNPDEIFCMFEEQLYIDQVDTIYEFLKWVHNSKKCFGSGNYEKVFKEFLATDIAKNINPTAIPDIKDVNPVFIDFKELQKRTR